MQQLYRESLAFVYPSKYEGFGIPLLEAMRSGCPVIASNRSSFPQVVGNAGVLFEPDDAVDLAEVMLEIAKCGTDRDALVQLGFAQSESFTWKKVAQRTERVYRQLVD